MSATPNRQLVGGTSTSVIVGMLQRAMTPTEAIEHAAWLVAIADIVEPGAGDHWDDVLAAVRSS